MTAIALLLLVISFSLFITRTAALMLELTGMSRESARFQARAAYCGVGYANKESERIMTHPLRRQIISTLMLLGNAGTATVVATLVISFTALDNTYLLVKILLLALGLVTILFLANSTWVDTQMRRFIKWALKRYSTLDLTDYLTLLHLAQGYTVLETKVAEGDWLGGADLQTLSLPKEGVLVLGVHTADGEYLGAPSGKSVVNVGDTLTLYGKLERLEELNNRRLGRAGIYAHQAAVVERKQEEQTGSPEQPEPAAD